MYAESSIFSPILGLGKNTEIILGNGVGSLRCGAKRREIQTVFGFCAFARDMLNRACGWGVSQEKWLNLIQQGSPMERSYHIIEGYLPIRDDVLPDRLFQDTICNKYNEPKALNRDNSMKIKEKKYLSFELNNHGIPPEKNL